MELKGVLIGCRSYSFPDKQSGELIEGAKLFLAVPSSKTNGSAGYEVSELPYDFSNHQTFATVANSHALKRVSVSCDVQISGKRTRIKAVDVALIDKA